MFYYYFMQEIMKYFAIYFVLSGVLIFMLSLMLFEDSMEVDKAVKFFVLALLINAFIGITVSLLVRGDKIYIKAINRQKQFQCELSRPFIAEQDTAEEEKDE